LQKIEVGFDQNNLRKVNERTNEQCEKSSIKGDRRSPASVYHFKINKWT